MAMDSSNGWSSALAGGADTIVARGTAPGPAALAVVRVSGPATRDIARWLVPKLEFDDTWRAQLVTVCGDGETGSESVVAIAYAEPRSYTGEDMLELISHGSPYLVERLVARIADGGARHAAPGEFTRRAVANGKMDLVQAEAVRDLVASETAWQARNARQQLAGRLSRRLTELHDTLLALRARLEGSLDFVAQGVSVDRDELEAMLDSCRREVAALLATSGAGQRIRDGVRVVIVGGPNSGKSTLFNGLIGSNRAITAASPGTTRDVLEADLELAGLRVTLVDTAGIRPSGDPVEREGVRRARHAMAEAGAVIELWALDQTMLELGDGVADGLARVRVRSKADLAVSGWQPENGWLAVSAVTGDGMDELRRRLAEVVAEEVPDLGGEVAIGERHRRALSRAAAELDGCELDIPELAAERTRWAAGEVAELIGGMATDDVLDEIFGTFCIGK
jgi:tRNA modification GTPase